MNHRLRLPLGVFAKQYLKEGYTTSLTELERWSSLTEVTEIDGTADGVAHNQLHTELAQAPGDKDQ